MSLSLKYAVFKYCENFLNKFFEYLFRLWVLLLNIQLNAKKFSKQLTFRTLQQLIAPASSVTFIYLFYLTLWWKDLYDIVNKWIYICSLQQFSFKLLISDMSLICLRIDWDFLDTSICLTICICILYLSVGVDQWHSWIFYLLRSSFLHSFCWMYQYKKR